MTRTSFETDTHGWAELLPSRSARPALAQSRSADWVVVGAGVTGLSAARRLAEIHPDADIVLVEAREIGQGATARSSGFVVDHTRFGGPVANMNLNECNRVNRINRAGRLSLAQLIKQHQIDCDWRMDGLLHLAADEEALAEIPHYIEYLKKMGFAHEVYSREDLSKLIGTHHYAKGLRVHDGALVQPAGLVRGLAATLPPNVSLFENTPVLEINPGKVNKLVLPNARLQTENVVLATNYEIAGLGFLKSRVTGIVLSGSFTRQLTDGEMASLGTLHEWGGMSLHDSGATVRLTADRRICIRNSIEFRYSRLLTDSELASRATEHRAGFEARFPQLTDVPFEFSWSGVEGVSRNTTNFFGEMAPRIWFAGGYNGSGLSRGTTFGLALADHANGMDTPLVQDCLKCTPAQWMPPEPLRSIGGNFVARKSSGTVGRDG